MTDLFSPCCRKKKSSSPLICTEAGSTHRLVDTVSSLVRLVQHLTVVLRDQSRKPHLHQSTRVHFGRGHPRRRTSGLLENGSCDMGRELAVSQPHPTPSPPVASGLRASGALDEFQIDEMFLHWIDRDVPLRERFRAKLMGDERGQVRGWKWFVLVSMMLLPWAEGSWSTGLTDLRLEVGGHATPSFASTTEGADKEAAELRNIPGDVLRISGWRRLFLRDVRIPLDDHKGSSQRLKNSPKETKAFSARSCWRRRPFCRSGGAECELSSLELHFDGWSPRPWRDSSWNK